MNTITNDDSQQIITLSFNTCILPGLGEGAGGKTVASLGLARLVSVAKNKTTESEGHSRAWGLS